MSVKISCIADQHGNLDVNLPPADIGIVGGDIGSIFSHDPWMQKGWLELDFNSWARQQLVEEIVVIAGNHDFALEAYQGVNGVKFGPKITYLQDSLVEMFGLKIWGTPWSRNFGPWAFMCDESQSGQFAKMIPDDTDIVVSHSPMYGFGDTTLEGDRPGFKNLRKRIKKINPKAFICGHIHEGYGKYKYQDTRIFNCSLMNRDYEPVNKPMSFEVD